MEFRNAFGELTTPAGLSAETARAVFDAILAGQWTTTQVGAFVAALRVKGESAETIAAAAQALRGAMVPVEHGLDTVLDTCGTGGDGLSTVNISTGAAILVAATGVAVAKHGNRAVSSQAGSADVLKALGINLDVPTSAAADVLRKANIAFLMAPAHHPAMRHAAPARKELGIRSIFNCLGPLANPARATHQLLGAYDDSLRPVLASTLSELGTRRAWVVHSLDGMDEISPFGPTRVTQLDSGHLSELEVSPADFGLTLSAPGAVTGGDAAHNAKILEAVLGGEAHPSRDAFLLNAAAALVVAKKLSPKDALDRIKQTIETGAARQTLNTWRQATQAYPGA